jgi:uncharacterized membrane protein
MMNKNNKSFESSINGYATVHNTHATEGIQWRKYHSYSGAHGFAAEDANALHDILSGKHVDKVGISNELNGADRIVNGQPIQTKYWNTAYKTVNDAFQDGKFRYTGQKLEVPSDQYEDAVRLMMDKIRQGQVPGVSDPEMAKTLVLKGKVTYQQAVNIAKAGNIDSLIFDIKTQTVACGISFGLSFVLSYSAIRYSGAERGVALREAITSALKTGVITLASGVAAQQFLRTTLGRETATLLTYSSKRVVDSFCTTTIGKEVVQKLMSTVWGRQLMENAARNAATKFARTNGVTAAVTAIATTIPDVVKLGSGRISGKQFFKNTTTNTAGVGGGMGGAWLGGAVGTLICPVFGTFIGGLLGGIGGGIAASAGTKAVLDNFIDDDVKEVCKYLEEVITDLCNEFNKGEVDLKGILNTLKHKNVFKASFFEKAYQAGGNSCSKNMMKQFMRSELRPYFV